MADDEYECYARVDAELRKSGTQLRRNLLDPNQLFIATETVGPLSGGRHGETWERIERYEYTGGHLRHGT